MPRKPGLANQGCTNGIKSKFYTGISLSTENPVEKEVGDDTEPLHGYRDFMRGALGSCLD